MFIIVFLILRQHFFQSFKKQTQTLCCRFYRINVFLLCSLLSVFALLHGEHRWAQP